MRTPINFNKCITQNQNLLKPPVCNKVVWENSDFIIMVVGGPNSRKDYHVDVEEEFTLASIVSESKVLATNVTLLVWPFSKVICFLSMSKFSNLIFKNQPYITANML